MPKEKASQDNTLFGPDEEPSFEWPYQQLAVNEGVVGSGFDDRRQLPIGPETQQVCLARAILQKGRFISKGSIESRFRASHKKRGALHCQAALIPRILKAGKIIDWIGYEPELTIHHCRTSLDTIRAVSWPLSQLH